MIMLTRLNGPEFALNPDLIERAEETPDTVITLVDGKHYVVAESLGEVIDRVRGERALVLALATLREQEQTHRPARDDARGSDVIPMRRNS